MIIEVFKVHMRVDGADLIAHRDAEGRIIFQWTGSVGPASKGQAQRRATIILNKFNQKQEHARQLPLLPDSLRTME